MVVTLLDRFFKEIINGHKIMLPFNCIKCGFIHWGHIHTTRSDTTDKSDLAADTCVVSADCEESKILAK
jgi:hypothetical protein